MQLYNSDLYAETIDKIASFPLGWEKAENQTFLISGATGMIGSFLIDVLMHRNENKRMNCNIIALGRNEEKARNRFAPYWNNKNFRFKCCDINQHLDNMEEAADYILHLASNTHPLAYASDPIGTITANIIGTYHLLNYAAEHGTKRFIFASSVEIYGENRGDRERFSEDYMGYIDCNTLRAGYPESKRAGESLCQAFIKQKGLNIVIPRLSRTFGPTMVMSDSKALSQFIKKGIEEENIILKSEGTQFYSYSYVADAVSGILTCLFRGENGEAYNIADKSCDVTLRELAGMVAEISGTRVEFDIPDETERAGYSKATKAILESEKLQHLGWTAQYDMRKGLEDTIAILKGVK